MSNVILRNGWWALAWYALAGLIVLLDQYTKGLASSTLEYARPVTVFSWFDLSLHHNSGAAFSMLQDAGGWQRYLFSGVAVATSVVLLVWLCRMPRGQRLLALALALILGGALGNLWDRIAHGYVIDFISVHWNEHYFPTFNLADSAITIGAICMLLDTFFDANDELAKPVK